MSQKDFLGGLVLGAGVVWFFEPLGGARRRALVHDKIVRTAHELEDAARVGAQDLHNRAHGIKAEVRGMLTESRPEDDRLAERVRAALGHVCSHAHAVEVTAKSGCVRLAGPVLAEELDEIVHRAAAVRGVAAIENALEPHDAPDGVSALQGEHVRPRPRLPAGAHFALGIGSAALAAAALARGHTLGFALGVLGAMASARNVKGVRQSTRRRDRAVGIATGGFEPTTTGL